MSRSVGKRTPLFEVCVVKFELSRRSLDLGIAPFQLRSFEIAVVRPSFCRLVVPTRGLLVEVCRRSMTVSPSGRGLGLKGTPDREAFDEASEVRRSFEVLLWA